ncbi:peptidase domain-containing ABC transporter [Sphingobacterium sp. SYP-B4668]|uniref:peptidase domain-containing ABC transporter n=1 Tax=Sphingobacterium sp. SYP-B4668 TaxID=2996035 RepID=UPI0022DE6CD5|nr:peptidase domain-containing ABC transporter [Sphingobacterium sp. SYP-B4668]
MKAPILVLQHDYKDCGAACISSVATYYGLELPIAKIRQSCHTDTKGTNVLGMIEGLSTLGFYAKGVKGDLNALSQVPLPAIAHVVLENGMAHYVVIYEIKKDKLKFMDPAMGKIVEQRIAEFAKIWTGVLILMEPNEYFEQRDGKSNIYSRFWSLIHPHRSIILQALAGAAIYTLLGLSTSIYIQKVTDHVLIDGNLQLLNILSVGMLIILFFQIFIASMKSIIVLQTGQRIDRFLILGYYKHLLRLPQRFFDTMQVGEIISRVNDAVKIRTFINDAAIQIVVNVFIVLFSFILMFTYHWQLAMMMTLIIPFYIIVYLISNALNKKVERRIMEEDAELESHLVESLHAMRTIKQFGVEGYANNKTDNSFSRLLQSLYKSVLNTLFSQNASEFLSRFFTIILLWIGSRYVIDRTISPGELFSFYALIGYLTTPVTQLIGMNKLVQNALIAADRLFEIMDLDTEEQTTKIDMEHDAIGDIVLEEVSFSYGSRVDVFTNLNCVFRKGTTTAIIGDSGSGKTTLAGLLQHLYPIKGGKISIGDYNINYLSHRSLRGLISVVPQQINLFSGTVIENIALGDDNPDFKRILDLSKSLGILSFIEKLPEGFQSQLGEDGTFLSGGQKQRIAIARALYRNPEILILDEATSALDSESEEVIKRVLDKMSYEGKTLIIIAHRLSTIAHADNIMVLKDGQIIEEGNHAQLLGQDSVYKSMWQKQSLFI